MKKGISLIILTITIIVMIILAGTIVLTTVDTNMIDKSKDVSSRSNREIVKEEIRQVHDAGYYAKYVGEALSENTIDELANLVIKTNVSVEKFAIYYDVNDNKDYIFYRLDKVTKEEAEKIEAEVMPDKTTHYTQLMGDVNMDGLLTEDDTEMLTNIINNNTEISKIQKYLADVDCDSSAAYTITLTSTDVTNLLNVVRGTTSISTLIDECNTEGSKHTGITYFEHEESWN